MLYTLGTKQHSEDLVDLLLACHGRIRSFLEIAVAIGERTDLSEGDVADASARVQRYFSEALPLHVDDEEDSVLPRLHGRSPDLGSALDRMCEEHDRHVRPVRRLCGLSSALRSEPGLATLRAELAQVARRLRAELEPHLETEELVILPAIRSLLTVEEQRAIIRELRARRQAR